MTLLTQRVNSLRIELKLIKTVYSASIPLTSPLKTRNSSSSFRGLINAPDQEQYHTLTFRDFQSGNEKRETGPGRRRVLAGSLTAGAADLPRQGASPFSLGSMAQGSGEAPCRGCEQDQAGSIPSPWAPPGQDPPAMPGRTEPPGLGIIRLGCVLLVCQQEAQQPG